MYKLHIIKVCIIGIVGQCQRPTCAFYNVIHSAQSSTQLCLYLLRLPKFHYFRWCIFRVTIKVISSDSVYNHMIECEINIERQEESTQNCATASFMLFLIMHVQINIPTTLDGSTNRYLHAQTHPIIVLQSRNSHWSLLYRINNKTYFKRQSKGHMVLSIV